MSKSRDTARKRKQPKETFYKVLVGGKSCHGGNLQWSLPKGKRLGKWHDIAGALAPCRNGLHVTRDPKLWWVNNAEVYAVAIKGERIDSNDKSCVRHARLLRRLSDSYRL